MCSRLYCTVWVCVTTLYGVRTRRNRLTTHFSERIAVVKRRISVLRNGLSAYPGVDHTCRFASRYLESVDTEYRPICAVANWRHLSLAFLRNGLSERCPVPAPLTSVLQLLISFAFLEQAIGRLQLKCDGTRWRTRGEVKGKLSNAVGSQ